MNVISPLTNTSVPATFVAGYWAISYSKPHVTIHPLDNKLTIIFTDVTLPEPLELLTSPFTNLSSVETDSAEFAQAITLTFSDTDMQTHQQEAVKFLQSLGI